MTQQEKDFVNSINNKIETFKIPTTLKEVLEYYTDTFIETTYNDSTTELVDMGVEYRLCQLSAYYFIKRYAYIQLPGTGTIPFDLYYFQEETLKQLPDLKKTVFLKTRQCLTEDNFVMTDKGYVSIKNVKPGNKIETIVNGKPVFALVEDFINQGEKKVCRVLTSSGSEVKCTLDHEILTKEGWKEAKDLTLKDEIVSKQGYVKVDKLETLKDKESVYDITTSTNDFLSNNLMVHNCGISTVTSVYCFWLGNFHESESIDVVSTKQTKAQAFVSKMDATYKNMPLFLRTPTKNKNMHGIKWQNGSEIISETASETAGRGDSLSLLVLDEAAHYQSDRLTRGIVGAAMPTLSRTGGSLMVISTPNRTFGAGSYYYEQVNQLQITGNTLENKLIEIDWWEIPDIRNIKPYRGYNEKLQEYINKSYFHNPLVKEHAKRSFKEIEENWRENDFLKKQYEDLGSILFKQEIFHDFIVGEDQVFDENVLDEIKDKLKDYKLLYENEINGNKLNGLLVWNLPVPKRRYILGVDISTGTGKDFSSIQVMDIENYEQVAEYKAKTSTKRLGKIVKILAKYYNQGFVVIECNSIGEAVFNEVYYHDTDPYDNVFKKKKSKDGISRFTGWETSSKSRQLLSNDIIDWINVDDLRQRLIIKSPRLYKELTTWVWKNGRADHLDGSHDDALIAFGLCIHLRNKATEYGESFFIGDDGTLFQFTEEDKSRDVSDGFGFETTEEIRQDSEDLIRDQYGVGLDEYKWLIG